MFALQSMYMYVERTHVYNHVGSIYSERERERESIDCTWSSKCVGVYIHIYFSRTVYTNFI